MAPSSSPTSPQRGRKQPRHKFREPAQVVPGTEHMTPFRRGILGPVLAAYYAATQPQLLAAFDTYEAARSTPTR